MKVKEENEKAGLKLNIQKTKIMAFSPITSGQIDGETMETMKDFVFLVSKIIADSDCSHEIKRCLLLGRQAMINLDRVLKKQRHYFAYKGLYSQSYGLSSSHVWIWDLDHKKGWTPKNWCIWTVVLEETLESPWTARRSSQSILKEVNLEYSLEQLMLRLSPILWPPDGKEMTHWKRPWCWERLKAGEVDDRGWDGRMASPTSAHEFEQTPGDSERLGSLVC